MEFDKRWLEPERTDSQTVENLKNSSSAALAEAFGGDIAFGTAGMRGVMGAGTNRMNTPVVGRATQAFADCLKSMKSTGLSVAIGYDSRHKSEEFAQKAAEVLAANDIKVYIFKELMPTPALSYAVRRLGCCGGIMITASHNPAQYNGYKVYGSDGGQLVAEMAAEVERRMNSLDIFEDVADGDFQKALAEGKIQYMPHQVEEGYFSEVLGLMMDRNIFRGSELSVVYTPLCGAGKRSVLTVLERAGLTRVEVVPEQSEPDGDFTACPSPNPENSQAMEAAIALAKEKNADLVLATDPDCDRVGVAVLENGEYIQLTGNEVGCLMLNYICDCRWEKGNLTDAVAVKSIVTTPLADKIAAKYSVKMVSLLTGFKYIGEYITSLSEGGGAGRFVMGFEESCGYLTGTHVRDKDAVNACLIIAEMAAHYKKQGCGLYSVLQRLYKRYGTYLSSVDSINFEGSSGMAEMADIVEKLCNNPPKAVGNSEVTEVSDYSSSVCSKNGERTVIDLPKSQVLALTLADGCSVVVRPSGTEPKLKIYYTIIDKDLQSCMAKETVLKGEIRNIIGK